MNTLNTAPVNVMHSHIVLPLSTQHPHTSHALTFDLSTCSTSFTHHMQSHCLCSLPPQIRDGSRLSVHLILDDPAGNSYIQVCTVNAPPHSNTCTACAGTNSYCGSYGVDSITSTTSPHLTCHLPAPYYIHPHHSPSPLTLTTPCPATLT